jgi:hypothetical protein
MQDFRYRQIHLDFHTSEYITDIGSDFESEAFAGVLAEAAVDSITCFARCHHGWLYYPSRRHPGLVHPGLKDSSLLPRQIEACHKHGIKAPIYTTVQWDARIMREHPDWLAVDEHGDFINTQNIPDPHFYHTICLNSPYREFFREHLEDIIDSIGKENIDGLFMDILFQVDCSCQHCRSKMRQLGIDENSRGERLRYSAIMLDEFKAEITEFIRERLPQAGIFYNSSHVGPGTRDSFLKHYSHLELESLPSGGWGYDHFPATSRYARTLGMNMIGMTGKFHTYWGDFHSLKNRAALEFECFQMLALGAGCSIGDQLHPGGKLSPAAYDLIGHVYSSVRAKEPWCREASSAADIAVLTPEEFYPADSHNLGISPALIGAVRMLQELACQFDIVDSKTDLSQYKLLILPDVIYHNPELEHVLRSYLAAGGSIIGSYDSCLPREQSDNIYGIKLLGESRYYREFVMPNDQIGQALPREEFVMYLRGYDVQPIADGCRVLMDKIEPWFDRSGKTFCSHQHAPSSGRIGHPAVTRNGNAVYFSHPIFSLYRKNAPAWCKHMVSDAIAQLMDYKQTAHDGPSTVIMSLNHQSDHNRDVLHILHYITEKRSEDIYTIEDVIPLHNLNVKVHTGQRQVRQISLVPEEQSIDFKQDGSQVSFTLDRIDGHRMVSIQY